MKIAIMSDLHLEFGWRFDLSEVDRDADLLVLAGDICTFKDVAPLVKLLEGWRKPVIYVAGNHEYYTRRPMHVGRAALADALQEMPNVHFLHDDAVTIDGVHFFGGTMWTDFDHASPPAMNTALMGMSDYRHIYLFEGCPMHPNDTTVMHRRFVAHMREWFDSPLPGPRVVVSHHAPVVKRGSRFLDSLLRPAFNSLDMPQLIERHQPDLWIYGHTHENDDQMIGKTRIITNQRGYSTRERAGFDPAGRVVDLVRATA